MENKLKQLVSDLSEYAFSLNGMSKGTQGVFMKIIQSASQGHKVASVWKEDMTDEAKKLIVSARLDIEEQMGAVKPFYFISWHKEKE